MSEQKRYTALEMREAAQCLHYNSPTKLTIEAAAMLRQAAETEEELAQLKGDRNGILKANESLAKDNDRLRGKNAQLKAHLEAVECKVMDLRVELYKVGSPDLYKTLTDAILRAARGESENENK